MARSRNVKPGFFTNDVLCECHPLARILFEGLWCHADREGRLEYRPKKFKAEILPYDKCDIEDLLNQLESRGFIDVYEVNGISYLQVVNFAKHQNPHMREPASTIPAMCKHSESTMPAPDNNNARHQPSPADSLNLIPLTPSLIPDSINTIPPGADAPGRQKSDQTLPVIEYPQEFDEIWQAYPRRPGASKKDAFKAWRARVKEGRDPAVLLAGVKRYAAYCLAERTEGRFIKHPATFLGPDEHYLADWTPPPRASPGKHSGFEDIDYHAGIGADGRF